MSYNEIMQALENGKKVFWVNISYKVFIDNNTLHVINIYNDYMCRLQPSELKDCFIGE